MLYLVSTIFGTNFLPPLWGRYKNGEKRGGGERWAKNFFSTNQKIGLKLRPAYSLCLLIGVPEVKSFHLIYDMPTSGRYPLRGGEGANWRAY